MKLLLSTGLVLIGVTIAGGVATGQTPSLTDQINNVAQAQEQQDAARAARRAAAARHYRAEQARARAREQARRKAEEARRKARDAAEAKIASEDRQFVLEQRQLRIEEEKLHLKAQTTLVGRENDVINSSLARQKAKTDLVQSEADSNRDLAQGTKTLLQDAGTADINRSLSDHGLSNSNPDKVDRQSSAATTQDGDNKN